MTKNGQFKRRVRARAEKTGESYTTALMHLRREAPKPQGPSLRLAVVQTKLCDDPRDAAALRQAGEEMRRLMREAHKAGARLVQFPEGTICAPNKRILSAEGPEKIGPADWSRVEWDVLRTEMEAARALARELKLWIVFGSVHRLTPPNRPHNSLYVISDRGELATRYDERMLSNTKISFLYTPGSAPLTFEVDGLRFGCALGMEAHFPELFVAYERLQVDCVLFSTTGGTSAFAAEMQGIAASNSLWSSFAVHAQQETGAPAGIVDPKGQWAARCLGNGVPALAITEIARDADDPARPWRRKARSGIYEPHLMDDPRSVGRNTF